jgi:hypothetical protein
MRKAKFPKQPKIYNLVIIPILTGGVALAWWRNSLLASLIISLYIGQSSTHFVPKMQSDDELFPIAVLMDELKVKSQSFHAILIV